MTGKYLKLDTSSVKIVEEATKGLTWEDAPICYRLSFPEFDDEEKDWGCINWNFITLGPCMWQSIEWK